MEQVEGNIRLLWRSKKKRLRNVQFISISLTVAESHAASFLDLNEKSINVCWVDAM